MVNDKLAQQAELLKSGQPLPVVEKPQEEPPAVEAPVAETKPEDTPPVAIANPFDAIKELTKGVIYDEGTLDQVLRQQQLANDILNDPELKSFYEFKKNGGDPQSYYKAQATDYKTLGKDEIIKMRLAEEYPTATKEQINALYEKRYPSIEEDDTSIEAHIARMELDKEYNNTLKYYEDKKVKSLTVGKSPEQIEREQQLQQQIDEFQKEGELYANTTQKAEYKYSVKNMELPDQLDDYSFEYVPDVNDKALNVKLQKDPTLLPNELFVTEGGKFDRDKLTRVIMYARNESKFISALVNNAVAKEREKWLNKLQNADVATHANPAPRKLSLQERNQQQVEQLKARQL